MIYNGCLPEAPSLKAQEEAASRQESWNSHCACSWASLLIVDLVHPSFSGTSVSYKLMEIDNRHN